MTQHPPPLSVSFLGDLSPHLDAPWVETQGRLVLGAYGGRASAGATKNEDTALAWADPDGTWEFAFVADAHFTAQSAEALLADIAALGPAVADWLRRPPATALRGLERRLVRHLRGVATRKRLRSVVGEASCLFCARRGRYVMWLSVGDCVGWAFGPDRHSDPGLNRRVFGEWLGARSSFDREIPCYSSGVRELEEGRTVLWLASDGLVEFGRRPFESGVALKALCDAAGLDPAPDALARAVQHALDRVHADAGRDSATIVAWPVSVEPRPSDD